MYFRTSEFGHRATLEGLQTWFVFVGVTLTVLALWRALTLNWRMMGETAQAAWGLWLVLSSIGQLYILLTLPVVII